MQLHKKTLLSIASLATILSPLVAHAATLQQVVDGLKVSLTGLGISLGVIGFMVAGIMFILATTDPKKMDTAKQALLAAIIGIVIIVLASSADTFVKNLFGL